MSDGGKGHTQRPIEDKKKFDDNWERKKRCVTHWLR
jgi:hypothetical protein